MSERRARVARKLLTPLTCGSMAAGSSAALGRHAVELGPDAEPGRRLQARRPLRGRPAAPWWEQLTAEEGLLHRRAIACFIGHHIPAVGRPPRTDRRHPCTLILGKSAVNS